MTSAYLITTIVVSLTAIVALWLGPLTSLRRDNFRSDIRRIREDLFDFMLENGFSFEVKAYRDTRQFLNGMLRASNWLSLRNLLLAFFFYKWHLLESKEEFTSYENCSDKLQKKLEDATTSAL